LAECGEDYEERGSVILYGDEKLQQVGMGGGGGDLGGVGEVDRTDKRQTQKWTDTLVGQCLQGGPGLGLRFECSPMKNCSNEEDETGQGAAAAAASNCLEPAMGIVSCW